MCERIATVVVPSYYKAQPLRAPGGLMSSLRVNCGPCGPGSHFALKFLDSVLETITSFIPTYVFVLVVLHVGDISACVLPFVEQLWGIFETCWGQLMLARILEHNHPCDLLLCCSLRACVEHKWQPFGRTTRNVQHVSLSLFLYIYIYIYIYCLHEDKKIQCIHATGKGQHGCTTIVMTC